MATYRSPAVLLSADGTRTSGTAALFTEPGCKGGIPPWAGDFRLAADSPGIKNPVGKTLTLEMPDGRSGKVVVQSNAPRAVPDRTALGASIKDGSKNTVLALMGEDLAPF